MFPRTAYIFKFSMIDPQASTFAKQNIIRRIRVGDIEAFELAFKQYYPRLKLYGCRLTGDPSQAEDFVQDTFAGLWEKRAFLNDQGNLAALLFKSLRNKYLNYLEHNKVIDKYLKANDPNDPSQGLFMLNFLDEDEYEELRSEMMKEVYRLLDTLPENCKKSFLYSRIDNLKNKEVADRMNLNIKTVEKHIARAMKLLKCELKKKDHILYFMFLFC